MCVCRKKEREREKIELGREECREVANGGREKEEEREREGKKRRRGEERIVEIKRNRRVRLIFVWVSVCAESSG